MNKTIKVLSILIAIGVVATLVIAALWHFNITPNQKKEEEVKIQAEDYLNEHFKGKGYQVYDVLYDNMGNYGYFDYAAQVRNDAGTVDFLVYYNKNTQRMEDSYTTDKEVKKVNEDINPKLTTYAKKLLGDKMEISAEYDHGQGKPIIIMRIHRKPVGSDEHNFYDIVNYLHTYLKVKHADVNLFYPDSNVETVLNKSY